MSVIEVDGQWFTDEELEEQALAADPATMAGDDAVPLATTRVGFGDLLPDWYMPAPAAMTAGRRPRRVAVAVVVLSLLLVNAFGLCVTYGQLEIAW